MAVTKRLKNQRPFVGTDDQAYLIDTEAERDKVSLSAVLRRALNLYFSLINDELPEGDSRRAGLPAWRAARDERIAAKLAKMAETAPGDYQASVQGLISLGVTPEAAVDTVSSRRARDLAKAGEVEDLPPPNRLLEATLDGEPPRPLA